MSTASVSSSKREVFERNVTELKQEIEAIKALNKSLSAHLGYLRTFKKDLAVMDDNFHHLAKVNTEWLHVVPKIEKTE